MTNRKNEALYELSITSLNYKWEKKEVSSPAKLDCFILLSNHPTPVGFKSSSTVFHYVHSLGSSKRLIINLHGWEPAWEIDYLLGYLPKVVISYTPGTDIFQYVEDQDLYFKGMQDKEED